MLNRFVLFIRLSIPVVAVALLLSGCPAPVVEYPVPARRVNEQSTDYPNVPYEGQVSQQTYGELQQRYPAGFYEQSQPAIPSDQQIRVSFRLFTSNPEQPDLAKMVTDTFINVFTQSMIFNVIEREQINQLATELELNQSGLVNQDQAPDTGQFDATDVIVTGAIDQAGGRIVDARALDVASGRVVLSERLTPAVIDRQSAEMLARMFLDKMKAKYYTSN